MNAINKLKDLFQFLKVTGICLRKTASEKDIFLSGPSLEGRLIVQKILDIIGIKSGVSGIPQSGDVVNPLAYIKQKVKTFF